MTRTGFVSSLLVNSSKKDQCQPPPFLSFSLVLSSIIVMMTLLITPSQVAAEVHNTRTRETKIRIHNRTTVPTKSCMGQPVFRGAERKYFFTGWQDIPPGSTREFTVPATNEIYYILDQPGRGIVKDRRGTETSSGLVHQQAFKVEISREAGEQTMCEVWLDGQSKGTYTLANAKQMGFRVVDYQKQRLKDNESLDRGFDIVIE